MQDDLNPSFLELDPKHPGINDAHYINRRTYFFNISREYRLAEKGIPIVVYDEQEHAIWRHIAHQLRKIHEDKACSLYIEGKHKLGLSDNEMPQLYYLDQSLRQFHGLGIAPAEGLLHTRTFFHYLSQGLMPCTQFIRHGANPEYTPEPDAVHDVLGHIPAMVDKTFAEIVRKIGQGVAKAQTEEELLGWIRIYWFSIEFGMIEEYEQLKVFGAGILSSYGEMEYCYSNSVIRKPFVLEDVINTPYDPTCMQDTIFILSSIDQLNQEVDRLSRMQGQV